MFLCVCVCARRMCSQTKCALFDFHKHAQQSGCKRHDCLLHAPHPPRSELLEVAVHLPLRNMVRVGLPLRLLVIHLGRGAIDNVIS